MSKQEHPLQDKYTQCIKLLDDIRDILAMTLSQAENDIIIQKMTPIDLITEALKGYDLVSNMTDKQLNILRKEVQNITEYNKEDVIVVIDEKDTKDILQ